MTRHDIVQKVRNGGDLSNAEAIVLVEWISELRQRHQRQIGNLIEANRKRGAAELSAAIAETIRRQFRADDIRSRRELYEIGLSTNDVQALTPFVDIVDAPKLDKILDGRNP